jgi:hypothetical protein
VNAPGTAKMIPFFPLNKSAISTLTPGFPSCRAMDGSLSPTCEAVHHIRAKLIDVGDRLITFTGILRTEDNDKAR